MTLLFRYQLKIPVLAWLIASLFWACDSAPQETTASGSGKKSFEGTLTLLETQGITGRLFNAHTTFFISPNRIRREQRLGGLNTPFNNYAGMIVDLEKDSITLYYADPTKKIKHNLSIGEYQKNLKGYDLDLAAPSPMDLTFTRLRQYSLSRTVEDSTVIQGFQADYSLFVEGFVKQEVFDTKDINCKRELLELLFINLPEGIHFPLSSELKTLISDIQNDSLINNPGTRLLEKVAKNILHGENKTELEEYEVEELTENKTVSWGGEMLKKGIDLNFTLSSRLASVNADPIPIGVWKLPAYTDFEEIEVLGVFLGALPSKGAEFDD